MSSAYSIPQQAGLRDDRHNHPFDPSDGAAAAVHHNSSLNSLPANLAPASHLSPYSSPNFHGPSASPPGSSTHTPAESVASLSVQPSVTDYQEQLQFLGDFDPFVGADWDQNNLASPNFLQTNELMPTSLGSRSNGGNHVSGSASNPNLYPISPDTTPQLGATSPPTQSFQAVRPEYLKNRAGSQADLSSPAVVAPQDLLTKRPSFPLNRQSSSSYQLTPEASGGSGHTSDDDMAQSSSGLPVSPRVAVSYWDENNVARPVNYEADAESPTTPRDANTDLRFALADEGDDEEEAPPPPPRSPKRRGIHPPASGPDQDIGPSMKELAAQKKVEEKNEEVREWIEHAQPVTPENADRMLPRVETEQNNIPTDVPLGHETENRLQEGQTYFVKSENGVNDEDVRVIQSNRNWADAPIVPTITKADTDRHQPATSQQAIEKYQRMNDDVGSTISRAATWGTRPRSIAGMSQKEREDMTNNVLSGNILKKLSISKGPSQFLQNMRRPSVSNMLKRSRTDESERSAEDKNTLNVPGRVSSWKKQNQVPSINTAIIAAGNTGMSIASNTGSAAGHGRSGSVSATSVTSPKSPLGNLGAHIKTGRVRALSDFSRSGKNDNANYPHLVTMWRQTGGPPIAALGTSTPLTSDDADQKTGGGGSAPVSARPPNSAIDDEDDDEDDDFEDSDMKMDDKSIEDIEPTFMGFQKQVLKLNPSLQDQNNYLVDRIAYQQVVRYKGLLNNKVKHITYVNRKECPTRRLCIAQGGSANILDSKGDPRQLDPLSTGLGGSDGDVTPLEGAINQDSFPQDIPMPPTSTLPAEFECQLCYTSKTFKKPSDWTKHVHEDVQPFTCTWDRCREPKIFKRKADWVRHENEGHRHLEWWTCDVDDCHHTCYRRDNFLQHLVREHKFAEPKVKTKAAIKKHGKNDATWQKVEKCHHDTNARPQDEPCRFCGKVFPTWKKLTVHLAKHMEQISLPILRLVAAKDLDADTIISPVQEPPPRQFPPPTTLPPRPDAPAQQHFPAGMAMPHQHMPLNHSFPGYTTVTPPEFNQQQQQYFGGSFNSLNSQVNQVPDMSMGLQQPATGHGMSPPMGQVPSQYQVQAPTPSYSSGVQDEGFMTASTSSGLEPFPALAGPALGANAMSQCLDGQGMTSQSMGGHSMNSQSLSNQGLSGLGLQASAGNHLGYDYDPNRHFTSPHSHTSSVQGSVSPYGHSPHQGAGGFYSQ